MNNVLVVDDDRLKRLTLEKQLRDLGYGVISCENAFSALQKIDEGDISIVVTDLKMPGMDGIRFLKEAKRKYPAVEFVVMTAYGSIETAVEAIRLGAYDYLTKPFTAEELTIKLTHLLERQSAAQEMETLKAKLADRYLFHQLVATSKPMRDIFERAHQVADQNVPLLIQGETGTGKELLAQAIHYNSCRRKAPFVPLSCAVLSPNILESEIFGHEEGAFTGATRQKKGRFELAGEGTIFFDDIDDVPPDLQVKLLRVLQERKYERVGGEQTLSLRARIVCATKRDLRRMATEGKFREDLVYRIDVVRLSLPPLRERREDIPLLTAHFFKKHGGDREFSPEALRALLEHSWPGNVRELENVILQIHALAGKGPIQVQELPRYLVEERNGTQPFRLRLDGFERIDLPRMLEGIQQQCIQWAMTKTGGNQTIAAELLNLPRTTLRRHASEECEESPS